MSKLLCEIYWIKDPVMIIDNYAGIFHQQLKIYKGIGDRISYAYNIISFENVTKCNDKHSARCNACNVSVSYWGNGNG